MSPRCASAWARHPEPPARRDDRTPQVKRRRLHDEQSSILGKSSAAGSARGEDRDYIRVGSDGSADVENCSRRETGGGRDRAVPEGSRRVRVRGFEEGPHHEVVSATAGTDATGTLPAI